MIVGWENNFVPNKLLVTLFFHFLLVNLNDVRFVEFSECFVTHLWIFMSYQGQYCLCIAILPVPYVLEALSPFC